MPDPDLEIRGEGGGLPKNFLRPSALSLVEKLGGGGGGGPPPPPPPPPPRPLPWIRHCKLVPGVLTDCGDGVERCEQEKLKREDLRGNYTVQLSKFKLLNFHLIITKPFLFT